MLTEFYKKLFNHEIDKNQFKVYNHIYKYVKISRTKVGDDDTGNWHNENNWYIKYQDEIIYRDKFINNFIPESTYIKESNEKFYGTPSDISITSIDDKLTEIIQSTYELSSHIDFLNNNRYNKNFIIVSKEKANSWGLITENGETILPMEYSNILENPNASFITINKKIFKTMNGSFITTNEYSDFGLVNTLGECLLRCYYKYFEEHDKIIFTYGGSERYEYDMITDKITEINKK